MKKYFLEPEYINVNGIDCSIYGKPPRRSAILITASSNPSRETEKALYTSSFEAVMSGYSVLFIPFFKGSEAIEKGVLDAKGEINYLIPCHFDYVKRSYIHRALITNGMAISVEGKGERVNMRSVNRAKLLGSMLSSAVIYGEEMESYKGNINYIDNALDMGAEVAVLKSALGSMLARRIAREGATIISSFSDFLSHPSLYLFEKPDGYYSFNNTNFGILSLSK